MLGSIFKNSVIYTIANQIPMFANLVLLPFMSVIFFSVVVLKASRPAKVRIFVELLNFNLSSSIICPLASKKGTRVAVPRAKVDSKA
jgi:hypothetical protein